MIDSLKSRLIRYITRNMDRNLLLSVDDAIRVAYAKADSASKDLIKYTDRSRLRSQMRRYLIDDALAGAVSEGIPSVLQTVPRGEHYVVVCSGNITLSHIALRENATARPAKHRTFLAKKNAILEPFTLDMFEVEPPKLDDCLHVVAVILHPQPLASYQSEPAEVLVTVPFTNWSGYHFEMPILELLQAYDVGEAQTVADEAWPTLRDDLQKQEMSDDQKSG